MNSPIKPSRLVVLAIAIGVVVGCISFATIVIVFDIQLPFGLGDGSESFDRETSTNQSDSKYSVADDLQTGSVLDTLVSLQQIESRFDRQVSLDRLLTSAEEQRLVEMLEASADIGDADHRSFVQTNLVQKLTTIDPKSAMSHIDAHPTLYRREYIGTIVHEWSYIDLNELIDHAKSLYFEDGQIVLNTLVNMRDDLSEEVVIEIGKTLGLEDQVHGSFRLQRERALQQNPDETFMTSLGDDIDDIEQVDLLANSARSWLIRDGVRILPEIVTSLQQWQVRSAVLKTVFSYQMSLSPQNTFETAAELLTLEDKNVFHWLARDWAIRDPVVALSTVSQLDSDELRHELQGTVVNEWVRARPTDLLAKLDLVPEHLRTNAKNDATVVLAEIAPNEIVQLLTRVEDGEVALVRELVNSWSNHDAQQAFSWVLSNSALHEGLQQELLRDTIVVLSRERPHHALQMAMELPVDESGIGPEALIVARMASNDMEAARAMLPHVRDGPTKLSAYIGVGSNLLADEPKHAFELGLNLSNSQKTMYLGRIVGHWFLLDSDAAYESIDTLPSAAAKSKAAQQVLQNDQIIEYLTDAQTEHLHAYLNEEDARNLEEIDKLPLID